MSAFLFHPKCAAGAELLGTAVQLLGLRDLPGWMQVLGDQEFLRALMTISRNLETTVPRFSAQLGLQSPCLGEMLYRSAWSLDIRMSTVLEEKSIQWIVPIRQSLSRLPLAK